MQVLGALSKKELLIQQPFGLSADSADFIIQMCVIKLSRFPLPASASAVLNAVRANSHTQTGAVI